MLTTLFSFGAEQAFAGSDRNADQAAAEAEKKAEEKKAAPKPAAVPAITGIGVAVLDTGIAVDPLAHPGFFVPGSASFVGNTPFADLAEQGTHGTAVAQIIRHLTPASKILSLQTSTGGRSISGAVTTQALLAAASNPNIRVINHSNAALAGSAGEAMLATARADQVVVMGAGNDWAPYPLGDARHAPGLAGKGLVVGGLGPEGEMLGFSNRAGDLANHYVVTTGFSEYADYWGTSFATPYASALAAELRLRWPDLKAQEVVSIIKWSATDMGAPGVDEIYGWGSINRGRALLPLGSVTAPVGPGYPVTAVPDDKKEEKKSTDQPSWETRRMQVGAPIYSAVLSQASLFNALVFDQFRRDFYFDLSKTLRLAGEVSLSQQVRSRWNQSLPETIIGQVPGFQLSSFISAISESGIGERGSADQAPILLLRSSSDAPARTALGFGLYPQSNAGAKAYLVENQFVYDHAMAWRQTSIGHYQDKGLHSLAAFEMSPGVVMEARYSDVGDENDLGYESNETSIASHFDFGDLGVSVEGGWLNEQGTMFGGAPGGPMSADSSETRFIKVSGYKRLGPQFALVGSVIGALTQVDGQSGTLLANYSDMQSDGWLVGLHSKSVFTTADSISFTVAQPLRVRSGEADLDIAYGLDQARQVLRHRQRLSLEPSGTETLVEFGYRAPWGKGWNIGGFLTFRSSPNHVAQSPARTEVMAVAQTRF
ncbi:MAG: S8 family peptidase [Arenicellales bacterium]